MSFDDFVEANGANARTAYISGAMATSVQAVAISGTTSWVSGNMVTSTEFTSARAVYLDNFANVLLHTEDDLLTKECHAGADEVITYYTVPAGSSYILYNIRYALGPNDTSNASYVSAAISGAEIFFSASTGSNSVLINVSTNNATNASMYLGPGGVRIPSGSILKLTSHTGDSDIATCILVTGYLKQD